jgi:hypothetical protein
MSLTRRALACVALAAGLALGADRAVAQPSLCAANELFTTQSLSLVSTVQRHVEAADLNGDGLADLVISTPNGLTIAVGAMGSGGIVGYTPSQTLGGVTDATGSTIADFDGDGIKDIAVTGDGGGIHFFRGLGSGGVGNAQFAGYNRIDLGSAWDIAAADFNADGILDLVVSLRGGAIQVLIGQGSAGVGNGQFVPLTAVPAAGSPKGLALGDMDGDGLLDVVVASEGASISILRGLGAGGVPSGQFEAWRVLPASGSTFDVTVADFNKDGRLDIASANYVGQSISIILGSADFTFLGAVTLSVPGQPLGIDSGDFNHDGFPDLVVAATSSGTSSFTYLQNTGTVSPALSGIGPFVSYGPAWIGYGITAVDLDGDGSRDVLVPGISETMILAAFNRCALLRPILTVSVTGNGTVAVSPDQPDYAPGDVVQLTATPGPGASFLGWSGDLTGSANPASITMNTSHAVTAAFVSIQHRLTLTIAGTGAGTVTRAPNRATYDEGSTVTLTAVPAFGSVFTGWSGDLTSEVNPLDVVMATDVALTVTFGPDTTLAPAIVSITDVPLDQGGKLKLRWHASSLETPGADPENLITQYFVWREIPEAAFARASAAPSPATVRRTKLAAREYFWEYVTALPASRFTGYSYTAATTNDSTERGNPRTAFMIQARNAAGTRWWDSPPDSGYSVDNLAPPTPAPLTVRYGSSGNALHWRASVAPDLAGYRLHRGADREFVPSASNLVGSPDDTLFFDPTPSAQCYKLAAIDIHGNLSHFVLVVPDLPVGTLASLVATEATADRIRLRWSMSEPGIEAALYRRTDDTDWRRIANLSADGRGYMSYADTDVERGVTYGYRLGVQEAGGESFFAEVYVLAEDTRFAISGVAPNPSPGGRMTVRLVLPSVAPAVLELLDIAGRRLDQQTLTGRMGQQAVEFGVRARIPAGLYWLRLRQGGSERSVRAVVLD